MQTVQAICPARVSTLRQRRGRMAAGATRYDIDMTKCICADSVGGISTPLSGQYRPTETQISTTGKLQWRQVE